MPVGKRKRLDICRDCKRSNRPAITAARLGHAKCLTTAYRELGVFNERDDFGATPIHFAARNGHLECLKWLVTRSGVSPNAVSRNGATAAHDAAAMGHLGCLHYLLENTPCSAADTTVEGATVLHMACRFGRLQIVKWLMDYTGARPGEKGANGVTPVHLCAAKNHLQCLQWLTRHEQYVPNERTVHGATAVYFAAQEGSVECLQWLINEGSGDPHMMAEDGMSPIHAAAQAGNIPCLTLLTSLGVSIRQPAEDGATPAHFAAASGQVETLEWILDHGGSALDRDNLGGTPVHDAAEQGQVKTLSALISRGVPTHHEDYEGLKPLDLAKDNRHNECIQLLFKTITPTLLTSVTPRHSLTRASATENEQRKADLERQKEFESTLLSGVSEERKEAMWSSAQQEAATGPQPGLKLLLEGEAATSPSQLSLHKIPLPSGGRGSARSRRSAHHSSRHAPSSGKSLDDMDMQPYKPRPVLSPSLFDGPPQDTSDGPSTEQPHTKKVKTDNEGSPDVGGMEQKPDELEQRLVVAKVTSTHKASPIPQRAKFLRKFNVGGRKKISSMAPTQEGGRQGENKKGPPQKEIEQEMEEEEGEEGRDEGREDVTANGDPLLGSMETQPVKEMKLAAMQAGSYTGGRHSGGRDSGNPYDMMAEDLVSGALRESLMAVRGRGLNDVMVPIVTVDSPPSPPHSTPPPSSPPPSTPPPSSPPPTTIETSNVPVRQKPHRQKHGGAVQEKAVIVRQKMRRSLKTPDETVTVNFVPQQSNVKKSFPVTHARLLNEDDLSSPGSTSEEEEAVGAEESSGGFGKLNLQTFEKFGQDLHNLNQHTEREALEGAPDDGGGLGEEGERVKGEEGERVEGEERERVEGCADTTLQVSHGHIKRAISMGSGKPLLPSELKKWGNVHSLEQIDQPEGSPTGRNGVLNSVREEDEDNKQEDKQQQQDGDEDKQQDGDDKQDIDDVPSTNIQEFGSSAVYYKQAGKRREGEVRGADVLKRVSQIELDKMTGGTQSDSPLKREGVRGVRGVEVVRSGSVSEKMKLFGGGRKVTTSRSDNKEEVPVESRTLPDVEEGRDEVPALPNIEKKVFRRQSEEKLRMDGLPSLSPPQERKRKPHPSLQPDRDEDRKPSEGGPTKSPSPPSFPRHVSRSPPLGRLQETQEEGVAGGGVSPTQQNRRRSSSGVYSPLMVSMDASSRQRDKDSEERVVQDTSLEQSTSPELEVPEGEEGEAKRRSLRDERARRQLFALSADGKVGSRESAYMGWACTPQLKQLQQRWEKEAGEGVRRRVENLLSSSRLTGTQVPLEFRGLKTREPGRLSVWAQKAGSLQKVVSLETIKFEDRDIFIFLKEPLHGPILHHIYLWLGSATSELSISSAHQHCQQLLHCLSGSSPLHKETQGHESGEFMSMLGKGVASRLPGSTPYINFSLDSVTLYNLNPMFMSFQAAMSHPPSHTDLTASPSPSLLDTHTRVWVWLPTGYWGNQTGSQHYQKSVLDIGQSYLVQKGYPKWAPVTVLTQHCETLQFIGHFSTWPNLNFDLAPPTWRPVVKNLHLLTLSLPTPRNKPRDTKIYRMEGGDPSERRPLPPVPSSHLSANGVYMFQWTLRHASPLYMWVETAVCLWIGSGVADYWEAVTGSVRHIEKETPLTLVPSGQEPPQLLSFFQGHMVVHDSPHSSPHPSPLITPPHRATPTPNHKAPRLYQVSGSSLEHIKAIEVPPTSSSLCSTHCYILSAPPLLFSWSGHLSSEDTRTGALYIAQIMKSSQKPLLVAEGQEEDDFWNCLGGKQSYRHYDNSCKFPSWALPELYCCLPSQHYLSFTQLPPAKKKDLRSSGCYLMWYRNQLFVWVGSQWKHHHFLDVVKAYLSQFHSGCSARDFVVTVVHEGHEGEDFWQWFELQRFLEPKYASQDSAKEESTPTDQHEITPTGQLETTPKSVDNQIEDETRVSVVKSDDGEGGGGGEGSENVTGGALPTPPSLSPSPDTTDGPTASISDKNQLPVCDGVDGGPLPLATNDDSIATMEGNTITTVTVATPTEEEDKGSGHVTAPTNQITADDNSESMEALSISSLLTQPEDIEAGLSAKQKKRSKRVSVKSPQRLLVSVEVEGGKVFEVTVREGAPVITVMFQVAEAAGLALEPASSLFEIASHLKMHRPLEEHEVLRDVMTQWPRGNHRPKLLLRTFLSKNILWGPSPPLPKSDITAYLKTQTVPELCNELYYCPRATKLQWKKGKYKLGENGIYTVTKSGAHQLCVGLDHHMYTPTPEAGQSLITPTRFCFAMKPVLSWRLKDVKLFCSSDLPTMAQWVHAIRLLKHGVKLRGNIIALNQRLQKRKQADTTPPSLTNP